MSGYLKLAAVALITTVFILTVRKHNDAIALVLAIAGCCVCGVFLVNLATPVFSFFEDTAQYAGIDKELLQPLLKTVGVGLLTQFSSDICNDAGQTALAKITQAGGTILCVCISMPLLTSVLSMIAAMSGG